jgi:hypothetical protein
MYEHCLLILWRLFRKSSLCNLVDNRTHAILLRKARKKGNSRAEGIAKKMIQEHIFSQREEQVQLSGSWGKLNKKLALGARSCWQRFQSKLINGAAGRRVIEEALVAGPLTW